MFVFARGLSTTLLLGSLALGALPASRVRAQPRWVDAEDEVAPLRVRASRVQDDAARVGIEYLLDRSVRLAHGSRRAGEDPWLSRAARYLARAEAGEDPYATEARGEITLRGYETALGTAPAGYAVYVPPNYDPEQRYPLLVALHGGSSNGNLFLGLTLGAHVPFDRYREHWEDVFTPELAPRWIVVAPDGFGNSMWRFQGERDVLAVLEHALSHYAVDDTRVVLHGLSNGGLGAYNIGLRHAWRFSAVVPAAGAPGWLTYLGGRPRRYERRALLPLSASSLLEHARLTHLHVHHGRRDPGPMRPAYAEALSTEMRDRGLPMSLHWYAGGHDLVTPLQRAGRVFDHEGEAHRAERPAEVLVRSGDYRAARQHWLQITGIEGYPQIAGARARVLDGRVEVETERVTALTLHLRDAPVREGALELHVDGSTLMLRGPRGRVHLIRTPNGWVRGRPSSARKRPGISGPITDAYYDRMVHVYGSRVPADEPVLREAAEAGARGFFGALIGFRQEVVRDRDLSPEQLMGAHLVLYGNTENHSLLAATRGQLPIEADRGGVTVRGVRHAGRQMGARFIYPSPLADDRYVLVATGGSAEAVLAGDRLPAFLPDWVLYDARQLPGRRSQLSGRHPPTDSGYFDDAWQ
ncbi:MAG: prolyl oligopeptidase family serine peptidase [Sandaracinaceae bacterium]